MEYKTKGFIRLSNEMARLPDGKTKYLDEKRYGGNGFKVLDLAECKCEMCGNSDTKLIIHHNNGYSCNVEDLIVLCVSCHGVAHTRKYNGSIPNKILTSKRWSNWQNEECLQRQ